MDHIEYITFNENGSIYVFYVFLVQRGIKRKGESKAEEVLVHGIPKHAVKNWLIKHGFEFLIQFIGQSCTVRFRNEVSTK